MARSVAGHRRGTLHWRGRGAAPRRPAPLRRGWAGDLPGSPRPRLLRPRRHGHRRLLPGAQLRRRPPADRVGLHPLGRRRAQPRAALLLHGGVRRRRSSSSRRWAARTRCATPRRPASSPSTSPPRPCSSRSTPRPPTSRPTTARPSTPGCAWSRPRPWTRCAWPSRRCPSSASCTARSASATAPWSSAWCRHISVWAEAVRDGRPRIEHLRPLARLGGNEWSTIGDVREIRRIPYRAWTADPGIGERLRDD